VGAAYGARDLLRSVLHMGRFEMDQLTRGGALAMIRQLNGMAVSYSNANEEYRVSYATLSGDEAEASAYYTSDPDDALGTARLMSATQPKSGSRYFHRT
jgi:hypothetical protein